MAFTVFLSHDHRDKHIAQVLSSTLSRITLKQLEIWFSSAPSPSGGIMPGVWLDTIRSKLKQCNAIIVLLTPNSIIRPWVLFESGFGAANTECEVIPVCIGINAGEVPFPLGMYQTYQLADYESCKTFFSTVLNHYKIVFDEELSKSLLEDSVSQIAKVNFKNSKEKTEITLSDIANDIKYHVDQRIFEIIRNLRNGSHHKDLYYTIPIDIRLPELNVKQYLEIHEYHTSQDILDKIYYMLRNNIKPFTYLNTWMLREVKTKKNLILREVADQIPADIIFKPNSEWEVLKLNKPYDPRIYSSDIERWYKNPL